MALTTAEILAQAQLERASKATTSPTKYSGGQLLFDVLTGGAKAVGGTADVLAYPLVKGLEYLGAPVETFGTTKALQLGAENIAERFGLRPETEVQRAAEFLTPIPGLSKGRVLADIGLGTLGYLGEKAGQAIAPESPAVATGASLAAMLGTPYAARKTTQLAGALRPSIDVIRGTPAAIEQIAQKEVRQALGPEGLQRIALAQQKPSTAIGTGDVPLTAAEIAQTPSAAKYQQIIRQQQEANVLENALEQRKTEIEAAKESLGITPLAGELQTELRDIAAASAEQKITKEKSLLENLGLTPERIQETKLGRGATLQESLIQRQKESDDLAKQAWINVPTATKLDVKDALQKTRREYGRFGKLAKADTSSGVRRVINEVRDIVKNRNGVITVGELQDLRSAAGRAMAEASGKNKTGARLMAALRENIDNAGISYFYDPSAGVKGGLPGTAATVPDTEALTKLSKAIDLTRQAKQTFSEGVVGDITATRRFKPRLKTSKVVDKLLSAPENVAEISAKFGDDAVEMTEIRAELLSRLAASKNPTEFIGKHKDALQTAFKTDYQDIVTYAQSVGQKAPYSEYAKINERAIPNQIFNDLRSAQKFTKQFANTPIEQMARARFISDKLTKSGDPLINLQTNARIAETLFKQDLPKLERILRDEQVLKSPAELQKRAVAGNSITSQALTTIGAIKAARTQINLLRSGKLIAPIAGAVAGIPGAVLGSSIEAAIGAGLGAYLGKYADEIASLRDSQINQLAAQMLADPKLIKIASNPPSAKNINEFFETARSIGLLTTKQKPSNQPEQPISSSKLSASTKERALLLRAKLQQKAVTPTPVPALINVPEKYSNLIKRTAEKHDVDPSTVAAMIDQESSFNPNAKGPKTKYGHAQGLMQLIPATAKALKVKNPKNPEQNVEGGVKLLADLKKQFGSDELALAAYNWRPGALRNQIKLVNAKGYDPTWENIQKHGQVPLETRKYVSSILKKRSKYRG